MPDNPMVALNRAVALAMGHAAPKALKIGDRAGAMRLYRAAGRAKASLPESDYSLLQAARLEGPAP